MELLALEHLLYRIGMESETAYENMEYLCFLLGVNFPPQL